MQATFTFKRLGKSHTRTIWEALADKLGREPTPAEAKAEVQRILAEGRNA